MSFGIFDLNCYLKEVANTKVYKAENILIFMVDEVNDRGLLFEGMNRALGSLNPAFDAFASRLHQAVVDEKN